MSIEITESELLAELRKSTSIDDAPPDAMTINDLCEHTGLGTNAISRRLAKLRAAGRLREYRVTRCDGQGRQHFCRAFVLLPADAEQPKRKRA